MKTHHGLALILAMATATSAFAGSSKVLKVRAVAVHGNRVSITVTNESVLPRKGIVTSRVLLPGGAVELATPLSAAGGQTVTIDVTLPPTVSDKVPTGVVVDDGVPF